MNWIQDTIRRELHEFIIKIARNENLTINDIEHLLSDPLIVMDKDKDNDNDNDLHKPKRKKRTPPLENRCKARLLKDSQEYQCSHSAFNSNNSNNELCKIHIKGELKYGLIKEEIPLIHRYKFKIKLNDPNYIDTTDTNTDKLVERQTNKSIFNNNYDLSLYPSSIDDLSDIKIGGSYYLEDRVSGCLYLKKDNLYYVGKLRNNKITRF